MDALWFHTTLGIDLCIRILRDLRLHMPECRKVEQIKLKLQLRREQHSCVRALISLDFSRECGSVNLVFAPLFGDEAQKRWMGPSLG